MARESDADELEYGDRAPEFELRETDGRTYSLGAFDDHDALLVVFMCNHCPYVQAKFETMNGITEEYDGVAVVGINPNDAGEYPEDSFEKMVERVERGEVDLTAYLRDGTAAVARAYGAVCTPDPFLFENDDDTFRLAYHGRFDDAMTPDDEPSGEPGGDMRDAIDAVLAGETPEETFLPSRGCSIKWPK
ncbi:thioredoxin family protein [Natronomonas sp. LN261]|uniref:thioredoxin family protein n=1 Tax=Natronomonas sp. LN261 TaxID=2750669 RepID=UPI0015EF84D3|nr:thioredoxin family protein [Natronomonas sp. LN261]